MPSRKQQAKKKELPPALKQWAKDVKAYREKHSTKANLMTYKQAMVGLSAERKKRKGSRCGCGEAKYSSSADKRDIEERKEERRLDEIQKRKLEEMGETKFIWEEGNDSDDYRNPSQKIIFETILSPHQLTQLKYKIYYYRRF